MSLLLLIWTGLDIISGFIVLLEEITVGFISFWGIIGADFEMFLMEFMKMLVFGFRGKIGYNQVVAGSFMAGCVLFADMAGCVLFGVVGSFMAGCVLFADMAGCVLFGVAGSFMAGCVLFADIAGCVLLGCVLLTVMVGVNVG